MTDRFVNIHTHRRPAAASNCGQPEFIRGMLTKKTLARSCRCSATCRPSAKRDSISCMAPTVKHSWRRSGRSSRWRANGGCPWFCTASGLSSRSCANWTPAGPAQRSSTASSDRPNRPAGRRKRLLPLVRPACLRIAQNAGIPARNTPLAAFSRNRRQRCPDRRDLRARRESKRRHAGGTATGDAGKLRTDIYDRAARAGQGGPERRRSRPDKTNTAIENEYG